MEEKKLVPAALASNVLLSYREHPVLPVTMNLDATCEATQCPATNPRVARICVQLMLNCGKYRFAALAGSKPGRAGCFYVSTKSLRQPDVCSARVHQTCR